MNCCVGTCSRPAVVAVTFAVTGAEHAYCHWHGFDSRTGELRWKPEQIRSTRRV